MRCLRRLPARGLPRSILLAAYDLAKPLIQLWVRIGEHAHQARGSRQICGFEQQWPGLFTATVERECAQPLDLYAQSSELHVVGCGLCAAKGIERTTPLARGNRDIGMGQLMQRFEAAPPQSSLRRRVLREQTVHALADIAAGLRAKPSRVQAHLIGQACDTQPQQVLRFSNRVHRLEKLNGTMLSPLRDS